MPRGIGINLGIIGKGVSGISSGSPDTIAPNAPTIAQTAVTSTSLTVSITDGGDNVATTSYNVYVDGVFSSNTSTAVTSYVITGLNSTGGQSITVRALDSAGNESSNSNAISFAGDTTAPTAPTISETSKTDTTIDVAISGGSDDVAIASTNVYIKESAGSYGAPVNIAGQLTTRQFTALTGSTEYNIKVNFVDTNGNVGADSNELTITTEAPVPTGTKFMLVGSTNEADRKIRSTVFDWDGADINIDSEYVIESSAGLDINGYWNSSCKINGSKAFSSEETDYQVNGFSYSSLNDNKFKIQINDTQFLSVFEGNGGNERPYLFLETLDGGAVSQTGTALLMDNGIDTARFALSMRKLKDNYALVGVCGTFSGQTSSRLFLVKVDNDVISIVGSNLIISNSTDPLHIFVHSETAAVIYYKTTTGIFYKTLTVDTANTTTPVTASTATASTLIGAQLFRGGVQIDNETYLLSDSSTVTTKLMVVTFDGTTINETNQFTYNSTSSPSGIAPYGGLSEIQAFDSNSKVLFFYKTTTQLKYAITDGTSSGTTTHISAIPASEVSGQIVSAYDESGTNDVVVGLRKVVGSTYTARTINIKLT